MKAVNGDFVAKNKAKGKIGEVGGNSYSHGNAEPQIGKSKSKIAQFLSFFKKA